MQDFLLGLIRRLGEWDYLLLFLAAALEASAFVGLALPGETIAVLGGFMAQQGVLDLGDTLGVIAAGAVVGDSVGYALGRRLGRRWLARFGPRVGLSDDRVARAEAFFRERGAWAVVVGRFTALLRAVTPFIAGSSRMPYGRFFLYNAVGGIAWAALVVSSGYLFGRGWAIAERWLGRLSTVLGAVVVVSLVLFLLRRRRPDHPFFGDTDGTS
jgi:membrane protein DedA with SNARE-associated domain